MIVWKNYENTPYDFELDLEQYSTKELILKFHLFLHYVEGLYVIYWFILKLINIHEPIFYVKYLNCPIMHVQFMYYTFLFDYYRRDLKGIWSFKMMRHSHISWSRIKILLRFVVKLSQLLTYKFMLK